MRAAAWNQLPDVDLNPQGRLMLVWSRPDGFAASEKSSGPHLTLEVGCV